MNSEKTLHERRSPKRVEGPVETLSTCEHSSTVRVVERGSGRRLGGPTTICRTCHAMQRDFSTRWRKQSARPPVGAAMMPFVLDNGLPADCCIVKWNYGEPPLLLPTVPAAFEPDLVVGQHAAFLVEYPRRKFISAKVVYFGENKRGERGYAALTEQGITVRGRKGVYLLSGGGTETFWDACFFGLEADLVRNVEAHRDLYPREVLPPPPSRS